jgi:hypothetical protein
LESMTNEQKKLFYAVRNELSKKAMLNNLQRFEIVQAFRKVITNDMLNGY